MSGSVTSQELILIVQELMLKEEIKEYEVHVKGQTDNIKTFSGEVTFFSVVPKEVNKVYHLVLKTAKRSDEVRKKWPITSAYRREFFMYRFVFPEMRSFLISTGNIIQLDCVPKMYSACDTDKNETLILENLNYLGYRLWDPKKPMDMEHVLLVLAKIGKYHAISLAMRIKNPKMFEECTKDLTSIADEFLMSGNTNELYEPLIKNACEVLKKSGKIDLAEKFEEKIQGNVMKLLFSQTAVEDRLVICHGDLWNNNIMFEYKNSNALSEVCFIDFQLSVLDSPVKDLSLFLYAACGKSVLNNFEMLLQTYYRSLSFILKTLECDSCDFFSYEELLDQFRKYGIYGAISSIFFIRLQLSSAEERPEIEVDSVTTFTFKRTNEEIYNSRILDIFTHFGEKFL